MARNLWWALKESLEEQVFSEKFERQFEGLRRTSPILARYSSPRELVALAHGAEDGKYAEKDGSLHALVVVFQSDTSLRHAAVALLCLCLWPGLRRRLGGLLVEDWEREKQFSIVWSSFLQTLEKWRPEKSDKVAASLVLNTRRRVLAQLSQERVARRSRRDILRRLEKANLAEQAAVERNWEKWAKPPSEKPESLSEPDLEEAGGVVKKLVSEAIISQEEADLLVGKLIYGRTLKEMAAQNGLKPKTLSKRYERLATRIRPLLLRWARGEEETREEVC